MCASGARSPLAPTEPRDGTSGWTPALSSATSASSVSSADAREALGEHVGAQRHRRAHVAHRQRIADAGGVAAQQVALQRFQRVGRDLDFGERSESGVDAVDRLVAARLPIDDRARRADARRAAAGAIATRSCAVGDRRRARCSVRRAAVELDHRLKVESWVRSNARTSNSERTNVEPNLNTN